MIEHVGTGRFPLPESVDPTRLDLVAEFMAAPFGRHSEDLQLMLARMRSDTAVGRLVLLREKADSFIVARPPVRRGERFEELAEFSTPEDAERFAFALRFEEHTSTRLPVRVGSAFARATVGRGLVGYTSTLSVAPGDEVACHLSAADEGDVEVQVVRMRSGDASPGAPGLSYELVAADLLRRCQVAPQPVRTGSSAIASLGPLPLGQGLSLQVTFSPTLHTGGEQVLVFVDGLALALDAELRPVLEVREGKAPPASCTLEHSCSLWSWYTLVGTWSGSELSCRLYEAPLLRRVSEVRCSNAPPAVGEAEGAVLLAARPFGSSSFNGRLEQPAVVAGELGDQDARALAEPGRTLSELDSGLAERVLGWWDLSDGIGGWTVVDRGPRGATATMTNLPRRGVTGSRWDGMTASWQDDPTQFAAAHFLRDAIEDCGWPAACTWRVPSFVRPGFYAFRVRSPSEEELVPFFIRRQVGTTAPRPVLLLVPTATYLSYGNSRFWWEDPIQEAVSDRLVELGTEDKYLIVHPELGPSAYDVHEDGTDVTHVSHRRPNLFMRTTNRHFEGYISDLYLVDWLEANDVDYEVAIDDDLHRFGSELLNGVKVVVTGTHPEYVSDREFDALADFQAGGGRMMYLGGNGFQSRTTFSPDRPWLMENRRVPYWKSTHAGVAAEHLLAADGRPGGHLAAVGRFALQLVGVESATMGFDESLPFFRRPGLPERASFVFEGVESEQVGAFGLIGGGVVGQEWDNSDSGGELPEGHVVLASSRGHSMIPPLFGTSREPYHADMTLVLRDGGGACFSVGTMAWCAALSHAGYDNDVARVTRNVLERFLDSRPL
jgi:N,N-dimethylformamidase